MVGSVGTEIAGVVDRWADGSPGSRGSQGSRRGQAAAAGGCPQVASMLGDPSGGFRVPGVRP